jgi:hypothetical protein
MTCPNKPDTSVSSNSSAVSDGKLTLETSFLGMLDTASATLTEGDYLIVADALKKAREEALAKKSGKSDLHVRTKNNDCYVEFLDNKGECDMRIVRVWEKTTSGYITPGNHVCEIETRMAIAPYEQPAVEINVPHSFYIAMKNYLDMFRPKTVRIRNMGLERSFKYESWIETAMQEDIVEMKAMEAFKKAGGKDKYEDSDCDIWDGEYGYHRFEHFLLNRIQQL